MSSRHNDGDGKEERLSRGYRPGSTIRPGVVGTAERDTRGPKKPAVKPGQYVVRTWRRDGSTNIMALERAVLNLAEVYTGLTPAQIRIKLLRGDTMDTPRATFRLYWRGWREVA